MTAIANLPDIRPSLLLDFANSGRVDPRIQCTRASAATCFGPDGKLRTVPANVPRIDYDPVTGKCLGLLVEEARTNLVKRSNELSHADWVRMALIGIGAPDGDLMTKLVATTENRTHELYSTTSSIGFADNTLLTISVEAKADGANFFWVRCVNKVGSFPSATFNLLTGGASLRGAISANMKSLGGGVYRCSATFDLGTGTSGSAGRTILALASGVDAGAEVFAGDGVSGVRFRNVQTEVGTFPTSYIPTEASAVTRAADLVLQNPLSLPSSKFSAALSSTQHSIASMTTVSIRSEASNSNLRVVNMPTGRSRLEATVAGQNTNLASTQTPVITTVDRRIAVSYDGAIAMLSLNGSSTTSEALAVDLLTPELVIGKDSRTTTLSLFSGWLQRLAIYPAALSAAQLQRLTA